MTGTKSESIVQQEIMMEAAHHGVILMRNNTGAGTFIDEKTGQTSFVRFGLMNNSKEQNERIKGSDLVGIWAPYGIFVAPEVKREGWIYSSKDKRAVAQLAFIDFINSKGGRAGFCTCVADFIKMLYRS